MRRRRFVCRIGDVAGRRILRAQTVRKDASLDPQDVPRQHHRVLIRFNRLLLSVHDANDRQFACLDQAIGDSNQSLGR